ncbi:uncharacterized protein LOC101863671 isoform X1 [Aplysia californica]|uniref:Uncharacterized protein LOC101863671 isoform X1 n=1 Tax=Aplysia californica TaxID=6500 RepID=A0ABM1VTJ4_APLCA|nr:uncharacterized protein LOC101863671 isoform X1 [Aplysia californica]XP_035825736.1 uncharacterized protein LOC101863671 isoform X1 [Aplysia californica]
MDEEEAPSQEAFRNVIIRPNRSDYNNWVSQSRRNDGSNVDGEPPRSNGATSGRTANNGIGQLSNNLSSNMVVSEAGDADGISQPSRRVQNLNSNSSNGSRNSQPVATTRLRHRRGRASGNSESFAGPRTERAQANSVARNSSPTRHTQMRGTRARLVHPRSNNQRAAERNLNPEPELLGSVMISSRPQLERERFISPLSLGEGTDDNPFLLSPGSPDLESEGFDLGSVPLAAGLSDEEFARQLQQEEWEAASSHGHDDLMLPEPRGALGLGQLLSFQNRRPHMLPPIPRGERGARMGPRASNGRRNARGAMSFMNVYPSALPWPFSSSMAEGDDDHMPLVMELFHTNGLLDTDEIESILNPVSEDYEQLLALAEQIGEVNRGLSKSELDKLPTSKHRCDSSEGAEAGAGSADSQQCNICLNDYENGDRKRNLPCKHDFHKDCVDQWLKTNATCPVCRADVKAKFV